MTTQLPGKPIRKSRVQLAQLMQPEHANNHGNVHGGWIMKMVDEAGALACMRHAQHRVVTVAVDQMMFRQPIRLGDLVTLTAEISYTGRSSMEARVEVVAENPVTGECVHTNTAYCVYVALDDDGNTALVPPLIAETEEERQRMERGKVRQAYRISQRDEL
ncbi:MAG: acyl-CoA thioesterase [Chloroflexi bacterium]|jgi:acyl-CoA hydrolase|nr:acyl-CoA thioesterase [Chloroflexota bacterium]